MTARGNEPGRALVTGASSGIGAELARRLAQRGVEVWLAARRRDRLDDAIARLREAGHRAHAVELDVRDGEGTAARVAALDEEVGGLDLVVANAGVGGETLHPERLDFKDVKNVFDTNLTGALAVLVPLIPRMIARGGGHLVAVSSLAGEIPVPFGAPYGASKAGLSFFLRSIAPALRPRGVDVTIVHPGFVKTEMTEKNRFPMPFLLELAAAGEIIDRGIQRRAPVIRFPVGLTALMAMGKLVPAAVRDAVVMRQLRE